MSSCSTHYLDYRCHACQKLLFKGVLVDSEVEVKCKRCNEMNTFQGLPATEAVCLKLDCAGRIKIAEKC